MYHTKERTQFRPGHESPRRDSRVLRAGGGGALRAAEVVPLGTNPNRQRLMLNARAAASARIREVRQLHISKQGSDLPLNADTIHLAYLTQRARLQDENITDDLTRSQLTGEIMAKAILMAPEVSDAIKELHLDSSKAVFSEYNDILGEIIRSLPERIAPGTKTDLFETLKFESFELNDSIGHKSEISQEHKESHIGYLKEMLDGAQREVATTRAIQRMPGVRVVIPKDAKADLVGIDAIVGRVADGKTIFIDIKAHRSYMERIKKIKHLDWIDNEYLKPSFYTGIHERGKPHFLLDTSVFGKFPAEEFEFSPRGQEKLQHEIQWMLDYRPH